MSKRPYKQQLSRWSEKTTARLFTPDAFASYKTTQRFFLLGVMGFAGPWRRSGLEGEQLTSMISGVRQALRRELEDAQLTHKDRLVVVSGATRAGVLEQTYELCHDLGIFAMGVTPDRALAYPLGAMDFVVPFGRRFGDESGVFLDLCDAFLLLGGGPQSKRETLEAARRQKPTTVVRGFGGVADAFDEQNLPSARFIDALG